MWVEGAIFSYDRGPGFWIARWAPLCSALGAFDSAFRVRGGGLRRLCPALALALYEAVAPCFLDHCHWLGLGGLVRDPCLAAPCDLVRDDCLERDTRLDFRGLAAVGALFVAVFRSA